jgi:hypothetical protein
MSQERRVRDAADYRALAISPPLSVPPTHELCDKPFHVKLPWLAQLQASPRETEIAVRLADEGVPLAVIARATQIPSADLRKQLQEALERGRIIEMPRNDWPPYDTKPRRMVVEDRDHQTTALRVPLNRQVLSEYWHYRIDTDELRQRLQSIDRE